MTASGTYGRPYSSKGRKERSGMGESEGRRGAERPGRRRTEVLSLRRARNGSVGKTSARDLLNAKAHEESGGKGDRDRRIIGISGYVEKESTVHRSSSSFPSYDSPPSIPTSSLVERTLS
ncbi:hypothetical protein KM043_008138 [Ampulex compressa]|nr:hypothetical protein KM043_008138 [Ampulex compressa]